MSSAEELETLGYENGMLSLAYTINDLTNDSIEAASLLETHSGLEYDGRWESQDLQMPDERVEQELRELMNDLEEGTTAYRFLRQELGREDLPDQHEDLYRGLKKMGDDLVIHELMPIKNSYMSHVMEFQGL